jgi:DNA-binding winged helix-turn-helix (wHTH) protein
MSPSRTPVRIVRFGIFEADFQAGELRKAGVRIKLHDQSLQILAILLENPGELVTREDICKRLWPRDTFVDFDHGLNNAVNRLRDALSDSADSPRWVQTVHRRGYRFIGTANGGDPANATIISEVQFAKGEPKGAAIETASLRRGELPKSRSYQWLLWAASVAAILSLLLVIGLHKPAAAPSSRSFVLPPDGTTFDLVGDEGGSVALSADGTKLAFVAVNSKGSALIWVRPLGELLLRALN